MPLKLNYNTAALRVCVDQAEAGRIEGRVASQRLRAPFSFTDVNDLLLKLDALLDIQEFPQAFQRPRTFARKQAPDVPAALKSEEMMGAEAVNTLQGKLSVFLLYVSSRHSSTWQGFIDWLDGSTKQAFTSTLELLKILDHRFLSSPSHLQTPV